MSESPPATEKLSLVWSETLAEQESPQGSLWAMRAAYSHRLLELSGALHWREVRTVPVEESLAHFNALRGYHEPTYLFTLRALSDGQANLPGPAYGFEPQVQEPYRGMALQAARWVASAGTAVRAASGDLPYAVAIAAGQPHARPAAAVSGHLLNDVVVATRAARQKVGRVALVSLEAEFLPAVQETLGDDPDILVAFLHEGTPFLYPGGSVPPESVHVGLPPGAGDEEYHAALERVLVPGLEAHRPEMILLLGGASAHPDEPLAHMRLTTRGYARLLERLKGLAPRLVVLAGEGSLPTVSARFVTVALAVLAGRESMLPPTLPAVLAREWGESALHDPPLRPLHREMRDYVDERVEEAILLAQRASFPRWGLPIPDEAAALAARDEGRRSTATTASQPESSARIEAILQARRAPSAPRPAPQARDVAARPGPSTREPGDGRPARRHRRGRRP